MTNKLFDRQDELGDHGPTNSPVHVEEKTKPSTSAKSSTSQMLLAAQKIPVISIESFQPQEIIEMILSMSSHGQAPADGCTLFSIGNEEYIETITSFYLNNRFSAGSSAEKFIVGSFGYGKSHLVNQISEESRKLGCVTSTVPLTKNVLVTSNYFIYKEIAREIRPPGSKKRGMKNLINACFSSIQGLMLQQTKSQEDANELLRTWIDSLEDNDFELDAFGRIVQQAFDSLLKNDKERFNASIRWLEGEFDSKELGKILNISPIKKQELNLVASRVNLSLYQFIKKCGFRGTVVVFDEAEQGMDIGKKEQSTLFSLLQSDINSIVKLQGGSVLILFAIHSKIKEGMMNFPALQQRVQHQFTFSKAHPTSPLIEIERPQNLSNEEIIQELVSIGQKLVYLFYQVVGSEISSSVEDTLKILQPLAERCIREDMATSNRRAMVKGTCSILSTLFTSGKLMSPDEVSLKPEPIGDNEV